MMFRVFHYVGTDRYARFTEAAFAEWPASYLQVGTVEAPSLGAAFQLTNSIDGPWWENPGTTLTPDLEGARSLSVGDVLVDKLGVAHGVAPVGFTPLLPKRESEPHQVGEGGTQADADYWAQRMALKPRKGDTHAC